MRRRVSLHSFQAMKRGCQVLARFDPMWAIFFSLALTDFWLLPRSVPPPFAGRRLEDSGTIYLRYLG
jgi:hypothetical protein